MHIYFQGKGTYYACYCMKRSESHFHFERCCINDGSQIVVVSAMQASFIFPQLPPLSLSLCPNVSRGRYKDVPLDFGIFYTIKARLFAKDAWVCEVSIKFCLIIIENNSLSLVPVFITSAAASKPDRNISL